MSYLVLNRLSKRYGDLTAVEDLSLSVERGEFISLLGPSGCGKTTTLQMIAGFVEPSGGSIVLDGKDVSRTPANKRGLGMVFQNYALFPHMTAAENVSFGLEMQRVGKDERQARVAEALKLVGLSHLADRHPARMSGGQQQRVALARALVIRPSVLLLDEPLSNLDAKMRLQMRDVILDLVREAGITTVFVTHDQEEALAMSDRIAIMDHGRIAQLGTPEELYGTPVNAYVADFIGSANVIPVPARGGLPGAPAGHVRYELCGLGFDGTLGSDTLAERAVLIARPEELALMAPAPYVPNTLPGKVLRRQYLGFKTAYRIALQDGSEIRVELHAGNMVAQFQPGEAVQVLIPADSRVVNA